MSAESTDAPTVPRGILSYADAVRGSKKFVALRTDKPAQSSKTEPASLPKPERTPPTKVEPAKSAKSSSTNDQSTNSTERSAPFVKKPKTPAPLKTQDVGKKKQGPKFSYAEAARGRKPPPPSPAPHGEDELGQPMKKYIGSPVIASAAGANGATGLEPDVSAESTHPGTVSSPQKGKTNVCSLMLPPAVPTVAENLAKTRAKSKSAKKQAKKALVDLKTATNSKPPVDLGRLVGNRRRKNADSSMSPPKKEPTDLKAPTGKQCNRFPGLYTSTFTQANMPAIQTKTAHPRRFSDGDRPPLSDKLIEERIEIAIREEEERVSEMKAMEFLVRILIQANDLKQLPLWECQMGWDVMIECRGNQWRVHHDLLSQESPYFQERLPPKDPNGTPNLFTLGLHQPEMLGHALHFMYNKTYERARPSHEGPLDGEAIHRSVFMYLCGASVDYRLMMASAVECVDEAAEIVMDAMLTNRDIDTSHLFRPLLKAIGMALEQGTRGYMIPLRISMARLICILSRWMYEREDFEVAYHCSPAWPMILVQTQDDVAWFHAQESALASEGVCLAPPIGEQIGLDEHLIGGLSHNGIVGDGEADYDGETISGSEVHSNFGLDGDGLAPFSDSGGSGSAPETSSTLVAEANDSRCEASDNENGSDTTLRPGDDTDAVKQ